jgi:hypothetical protein
VATRGEREHDAGRSRHAGAEQQRFMRAFQRGDHRLGLTHGRIVRPAVAVTGAILIIGIADEGARYMHRQRDRLCGSVNRAERLRGDRAGFQRLRLVGHAKLPIGSHQTGSGL